MHSGCFKNKVAVHRATSINPDPLSYRGSRRCRKQQIHAEPRGESTSLAITPSQGSPSDGPLCSRHILPWRKWSWHVPTQSYQDHEKEKAQQHGSALERSQKAPTASFSLCTYDLLCTERTDEEPRERLALFPWSYAFEGLFRELNFIKRHCIRYHYGGTSLAFVDCVAWYIWKYPLRAKSSFHSIRGEYDFQL